MECHGLFCAKVQRQVYLQGAFNYSQVCVWALGARGIDLAQGTTDTEALNGEFIWLYRSHGIRRCKRRLWDMVAELFFLRVLWRRAHAHMMPVWAAGDYSIAQDLETSRGILALLQQRSSLELAKEWEQYLRDQRVGA